MENIQLSLFGSMSQGQSLATMAATLKLLSGKWETQGVITLNGESWTASGSESHSAEEESLSLLSGILQPPSQVTDNYLVSRTTAKRILGYVAHQQTTMQRNGNRDNQQVVEELTQALNKALN